MLFPWMFFPQERTRRGIRSPQTSTGRFKFRPECEAMEDRTALSASSVTVDPTAHAEHHAHHGHHHSTHHGPQRERLIAHFVLPDGRTVSIFRTPEKKQKVKIVVGPPGPAGADGLPGPVGPAGARGPSGTLISYTLAAGQSSAPITVPADRPVLVVATNTTSGNRGTASMTVEHAQGAFLEWSGMNSTANGAPTPTLAGGFSGAAGTNMLNIDFFGNVHLRINNADSFVVVNTGGATETGSIWVLTPP
jgi:hypothetical protein